MTLLIAGGEGAYQYIRQIQADQAGKGTPIAILDSFGAAVPVRETVQGQRTGKSWMSWSVIAGLIIIGLITKLVFFSAPKSTPTRVASNAIRPSPTPLSFRFESTARRFDEGLWNPRTEFMVYYVLNKHPVLSPIDLLLELRVVNLHSTPRVIEAWKVETGPTPSGPWTRLDTLPSDPFDVYFVGPILDSAIKVQFDDFSKALEKPIDPSRDARGWTFFECPNPPQTVGRGNGHVQFATCINRHLRLTLRDNDGTESTAVVPTIDTNQGGLDFLDKHQIDTPPGPRRNMSKDKVTRPYPKDLYWAVVPKFGRAQAFDNDTK